MAASAARQLSPMTGVVFRKGILKGNPEQDLGVGFRVKDLESAHADTGT